MRLIANFFADKIIRDRELRNPAERYRIGVIESWTSIAGNVILTLLKALFGLLTNSISLMADAVHSASDIFSSLAVLIGFSLAKRKPDPEHPHGHGRIEYLAGLLIAFMLIGAGIAFSYHSYNRLVENSHAQASITAIAAVVLAILVKEFMYFFSARLGHLIDSDTLIGDAWHHRSDSFSSVLVLIALVGSYLGMPSLDAYFGFAVSAFIIYAGYRIAYRSCSQLVGKAPDDELKNGVLKCAGEIDGVIDTHDLEIHDYGSWKVVTIHIEVNGSLNLDEAHNIANKVENHISDCYHCNTVVHLDPH